MNTIPSVPLRPGWERAIQGGYLVLVRRTRTGIIIGRVSPPFYWTSNEKPYQWSAWAPEWYQGVGRPKGGCAVGAYQAMVASENSISSSYKTGSSSERTQAMPRSEADSQ